ncbi:MAG: ribonuclease P protein component [Agarilytica sp.]
MIKTLDFPKSHRLLNSSDFTPVFDAPSFKIHHSNFLILTKYNDLGHPRLGIIVAKKNIRRAVQRNQAKRAIRESFRHKQHNLPAIDAIVLARRGSEQLAKEQVREILDSLWNRAAKKSKTQKNDSQNSAG